MLLRLKTLTTKTIFSILFFTVMVSSHAQTDFYVTEGVVVTNLEQIHLDKKNDAGLPSKATLYITEGTTFIDTNKQVNAELIVSPKFQSKVESLVSHIQQQQQVQNTSKDYKQQEEEQNRVLSLVWTYCKGFPSQFISAHYLGRAINSSTTSVPTKNKTADSKNTIFKVDYVYKYTNIALYNKQQALQPVSTYSAILAHRLTNLPPPNSQGLLNS